MSLGGAGLQGITVSPRFIFGVNGELRNNLYLLEDHRLMYTAGHNIVVYNIEDKSQYFLAGSEGTEGITTISVSPQKKYLAVCERSEKARCTIYDIQTQRKKKDLPDTEQDCNDYQSKEFVSCAFSPKNEKQHLITLTGEPDYLLLFWQWDKNKILASINIGLTGPMTYNSFKCSFNPFDHNSVVVTGQNIFKYYKLRENEFVADHTQLNNKDRNISTTYSCHAWMQDTGRLIVCTESGEIMLCETSGEYMAFIQDSPLEGFRIQTIVPFSRGFIIGGDNGMIYAYERTEDPRNPYRIINQLETKLDPNQIIQQSGFPIMSMTMTSTEDNLYFITENNQLFKVNIALDGTEEEPKFDHVICSFHSSPITGLDVCLRKQLIVTCSKDKTVRIWNYATKTLEICAQVPEEALAVAFHPSGFHVVVALLDKILMMNVLSKSLNPFKNIPNKACREVRFSNGGHLFATAFGNNAVHIYNFYTGECPSYYVCKGHGSKVRSIDWFDDDMGFASCDSIGSVYFYDLITQKDHNTRLTEKDFNQRGVVFTSIANIPGRPYEVFSVGNDKRIWHSKDSKNGYDGGVALSQICLTSNQKALFAGAGEEGKPGSIHIYKLPLDKINEVQAHSKPIERMKLSYDNNYLFTAGQDGALIIHDVKDRDPRGGIKREREGMSLPFSDEILTEKQEIENYINEKESLENDFNNANQPDSVEKIMKVKRLEDTIGKLQEENSNLQVQAKNKYDSLMENKREMENAFEERIKQLAEQHQIELEEKRNEYSQKMLEDAAKFQELQAQKEEDARKFEETINEIINEHNKNVNQIMDQHRTLMEGQIAQTEQLRREIEKMQGDNREIIKQIQDDAEFEIEDINKKNTQNQTQVQDMSLKSKAELQLTRNKLGDLDSDIEKLKRDIQDKETQLHTQTSVTAKLRQEIAGQAADIREKDTAIGEREKKIYQLKKKTQELEKFKFVLDYKIKELKRDIAPREMEITRLKKETNDMDKNLKHYNKINANLGYIVDDLRTRQEYMQELIKKNRTKIRSNDIFIKGFKNAVYRVVQYIDDFEQLKKSVNENLYPYVKDQEIKNVEIDPDIKKEYENQKRYLENSVNSLKKRLEKETQIHKEDNMNIMRENIKLIQQISELRKQAKQLDDSLRGQSSKANKTNANASQMEGGKSDAGGDNQNFSQSRESFDDNALQNKELQIKRQYIDELRKKINALAEENRFLKGDMAGSGDENE